MRGPGSALAISFRMCSRPFRAFSSACSMILRSSPSILMSIWIEVMPRSVPATLKSMSPRWSSEPRMSVRMATLSPSLMRPIATPAQDAFIGTPASISASEPAAYRRHRGGAVRLQDLGDHAQGVGEVLVLRQQRLQRALGEGAVPDLAAAGAADHLHLARGVGREVVVQHERLGRLAGHVDAVDPLLVVGGAEGDRDQGLGLAPGEQRRPVGPRQDAGLDA